MTGVTIRTTLYYGKHLFVHDLVDPGRSSVPGLWETAAFLCRRMGRSQGCGSLVLTSGLVRRDAHRFYQERMGYDRVSYVFRKIF